MHQVLPVSGTITTEYNKVPSEFIVHSQLSPAGLLPPLTMDPLILSLVQHLERQSPTAVTMDIHSLDQPP